MNNFEQKGLLKSFVNHIKTIINFSNFKVIFCGFSGGSDSVILLIILNILSNIYNFKLIAVHFDHALRGKISIDDANWCENFCDKYSIKFHLYKLCLNKYIKKFNDSNIESIARSLRINYWKKLVLSYNKINCAIALGHQLNDKIENLFLRLARGSNTSGLTSLRYYAFIDNLNIIRPLLDYSKFDIEQLLLYLKISNWRIDNSNNMLKYRRNFIRNVILPKIYTNISYSKIGIQKAYNNIALDADYLEKQSKSIFLSIQNKQFINIEFIKKLHPAIMIRVLRYWISFKQNDSFIPNNKFMNTMNYLIKCPKKNTKISISKNLFLNYNNKKIFISEYKKRYNILPELIWNLENNNNINFHNIFLLTSEILKLDKMNYDDKIHKCYELCTNRNIICFDYDKMPKLVILKQWNDDDKMILFGINKSKRIKKIFHDNNFFLNNINEYPILCTQANNNILCICGVRRSNFALIDANTTKLLLIKVIKIKSNSMSGEMVDALDLESSV